VASRSTEICAELAAHPAEPGRVGQGVTENNIDPVRALSACEAAVAENRKARNLTRLARVYIVVGKTEEALALVEEASRQGDPHADAMKALF
jgi:hypothetical protein